MKRDPKSLERLSEKDAKSQQELTDDQKVRSSIRSKEYKQIKEENKDLDEEENELKRFFEEGTKEQDPKKDPTIVRKAFKLLRQAESRRKSQCLQRNSQHNQREEIYEEFFHRRSPHSRRTRVFGAMQKSSF